MKLNLEHFYIASDQRQFIPTFFCLYFWLLFYLNSGQRIMLSEMQKSNAELVGGVVIIKGISQWKTQIIRKFGVFII